MRPLKGTDWKHTFSTLVSNESWAASPLQGRNLLVGDFEGWPEQGPVTAGQGYIHFIERYLETLDMYFVLFA